MHATTHLFIALTDTIIGLSIVLVLIILIVVLFLVLRCKFPYFLEPSDFTGKYKWIGVEYHRSTNPNSVRYKLYYPTSEKNVSSNNSQQPSQYFTEPEQIASSVGIGVGNILSPKTQTFGAKVYKFILMKWFHKILNSSNQGKKIPLQCYENAPPLLIDASSVTTINNRENRENKEVEKKKLEISVDL